MSIKNVPEETVQRLRERAARDHRSLQGELLNIVKLAALEPPKADLSALVAEIRALGISTPREAADMIREDRDAR